MATLNTIIQLRQGTTAEWNISEVVLKEGEMGLEYLVDGSVKIKAGNGKDLWSALPYIDNNANVYQVELAEGELDDIAAIEAEVNGAKKQNGDVAIVKAVIAGDKVSYTSYVYDDELDVKNEDGTYPEGSTYGWSAMDGNYSASNVFIKKGIKLTKEVGNYAKDYNIAAGTSLETILSGLLQKEAEPSVTKPSASISVSGGSGEVGTQYTVPTAKLSIGGVGSYTYGPATGVVFNIGDIKLAEGAEPTTASNYTTNTAKVSAKTDNLLSLKATGDKATYGDTATTYTFSGSASYQAATASPITNLGNPSKTQSAIAAGSCTIDDKTATFSGWRKWFKGGDTATDFNSATIRKLTNSTAAITNHTFELKAADYAGCSRIVIAIPTAAKKKISSVLLKSSSNADITGEFKKINTADNVISVEGANGYTAASYDVWEYKPASLDSTEVYTITIA